MSLKLVRRLRERVGRKAVIPVALIGVAAVVGLLMTPAAAQAPRANSQPAASVSLASTRLAAAFEFAVTTQATRERESVTSATQQIVNLFNTGRTQQPPPNPNSGYGQPPGEPGSPISYSVPPSSYIPPGRILFEENCSSCHGTEAAGSSIAPNLQGLGAGTIDFWLSTGRMPLANPTESAIRKPLRFSQTQILQIVAFVNSIYPATSGNIAIPSVNLSGASLSNGENLFVLNCAACHTILGTGDAIADNNYAPSLHQATAYQIVEAMRTGPGNMPRFGPGTLSDQQVTDIVSYVRGDIQRPDNHGGIGLGGIGPVAEGFVGLLIGVGSLMLVAYWLGDRSGA
jgi:ubiquinol-cytochrome c reductase cytochrome c subunit